MSSLKAKYSVGQVVHHKLFDYRGVILDVDPSFQASEQWYQQMAMSQPPKDKPWYTLLVHNSVHRTYVAERNLEVDTTGDRIDHPDIEKYFSEFKGGYYVPKRSTN